VAPLKIRGLRGVWLLLPPALLLGVVVEIIPGVSVAGMLAVVGGVDMERVVATMVAMVLDVLEDKADRSLLAMPPPVKGTALFCWRRIW